MMFRPPIYVVPIFNQRIRGKSTLKNIAIKSGAKKNVRINCRENFTQYMSNTTLHGLRYVGDPSLSYIER